MLTKVLNDSLRSYEIGEKLRALRLRKKMGLVELAKHTGLSPALLSKVERSLNFPPLPTLLRIAMVFGVGLDYFFADETKKKSVSIVRQKDRQRFPERPDDPNISYYFESLDFAATERKLSAYLADFQATPHEDATPHHHQGVEFLYLMEGKLSIRVGRTDHLLEAGDAMYFDSSVPHTYRRASRAKCVAMIVATGGS